MPDPNHDLEGLIAQLLNTRTVGCRVADHLGDAEAASHARMLIVDLRARRSEHWRRQALTEADQTAIDMTIPS